MKTIPYIRQKRIHSINVQCELYRKAVMRGLKPVAEYKYENCRFDIVMTAFNVVFAIVEVKNYRRAAYGDYKPRETKQMNKYKATGLPVFLCRTFTDIDNIVEECVRLQERLEKEILFEDISLLI
jgi:hypothetical protein